MQYQLTLLYQLIIEASFPIAKMSELIFQERLTTEKDRIICELTRDAQFEHVSHRLVVDFVKIHYTSLMEFEDKASSVMEPFRSMIIMVIRELKYFLGTHFHRQLEDLELDCDQLRIVCSGNQITEIIQLLVQLRLLKDEPVISVPRKGISLEINPKEKGTFGQAAEYINLDRNSPSLQNGPGHKNLPTKHHKKMNILRRLLRKLRKKL